MLYGQGRRRLNRHISGVKADITRGAALLSSSIILRDFFECCKWGTFRERPSPALDVCSQVFMRWKKSFIPLDPLPDSQEAKEFSLNPKEKHLYMDFYDLKSVPAVDLSPLLARKSRAGRRCCQILRHMQEDCTLCTRTDEWNTRATFTGWATAQDKNNRLTPSLP